MVCCQCDFQIVEAFKKFLWSGLASVQKFWPYYILESIFGQTFKKSGLERLFFAQTWGCPPIPVPTALNFSKNQNNTISHDFSSLLCRLMQQLHTTTPYLGNIKEAIKFYGNRQWKNKLNCTNKVQIDFEQEPLKTQNKIMGK